MGIKQNINARETCEGLFRLIKRYVLEQDAEVTEDVLDFFEDIAGKEIDDLRFFELLAEFAVKKRGWKIVTGDEVHVVPMPFNEAFSFEETVVSFGVHKGKTVGEIPPEYWTAITESGFNKKLARYLASRRFQQRQE